MITWELIAALAVYNFIMYVTPGPNNSILTASGIKFGFIRSIPNIFGIPSGHGLLRPKTQGHAKLYALNHKKPRVVVDLLAQTPRSKLKPKLLKNHSAAP